MAILLSAFLLLCCAPPASAGQVHYADHNGSLMSIEGHAGFVAKSLRRSRNRACGTGGCGPARCCLRARGEVRAGRQAHVFGCGPVSPNVSGGP